MTSITIKEGDALKLFGETESESVQVVIADPPYNLGKDYGNNIDFKEFDEYLSFTRAWLTEAKRVLKPDGTLYVFMGFRFISHVYNILERDVPMRFTNWISWHYTQGIGRRKGFSPRHDDVLMFSKDKKFKFNLDAVRVPQKYYRARNNMRGANPGDVWEFSHVHYCNFNRQDHPTQKPEALIERMVLASSDENNVVLDPFFGSGTTLRVCQQLGRPCIGFEVNPDYVKMTKERLAQAFDSFDSIDPRMSRIPNDLNDAELRRRYLANHKVWFLSNHEGELKQFEQTVQEKYGNIGRRSGGVQPDLPLL